jgi:crossover junction endodeoxyribonuclease RuvC
MTCKLIAAIDPGAHGAIAILDDAGDLIEVHDMPAIEESAGRPATNAPLLADLIARQHVRAVYCEFVAARPTDAKTSAFSFGRARGVIEGICGALCLPITFITPPVWKRFANVPPGAENKDQARARAIARWPAKADLFARKRDIDRAEAALLGWAALHREASR